MLNRIYYFSISAANITSLFKKFGANSVTLLITLALFKHSFAGNLLVNKRLCCLFYLT
ncbi:hypothetical protein FHT21_002799 [Pedobacter sp. SG908]|nr:hypothetical protein [Pedobacter sp. SG908]NMN37611.1 hypothetical protein [Pedobacter sp. SG918]